MEQGKQLITFADLAKDLDQTLKERDKLNELLNCPPRLEWIKKHPIVKVKNPQTKQTEALQYIPITTVRTLMKIIFQRTRREVKGINLVANSVVAQVRVHYRDPITGEWDWQDGVGAATLQLDSGAEGGDIASMKANAVQIAAPSAVSYAYKNACEEIGKIFGSDLQKSGIPFVGLYGNENGDDSEKQPSSISVAEEITTSF